jgi:hypothetical protein
MAALADIEPTSQILSKVTSKIRSDLRPIKKKSCEHIKSTEPPSRFRTIVRPEIASAVKEVK